MFIPLYLEHVLVSDLFLTCFVHCVFLQPLSPELRQFFKEMNVRIDSMDTKNACQTFNVLNQEARSIAAALLPLEYREGKEGA